MSTSTATARVAPEQSGTAARSGSRSVARPSVRGRLRVVPAPRSSPAALALLCVVLLGVGLLVLLLLTISIGKGAYELTALRQQQRELADRQQALTEEVDAEGAPQKLSAAARKLGMVPAPNPTFIDPSGTGQGSTSGGATGSTAGAAGSAQAGEGTTADESAP